MKSVFSVFSPKRTALPKGYARLAAGTQKAHRSVSVFAVDNAQLFCKATSPSAKWPRLSVLFLLNKLSTCVDRKLRHRSCVPHTGGSEKTGLSETAIGQCIHVARHLPCRDSTGCLGEEMFILSKRHRFRLLIDPWYEIVHSLSTPGALAKPRTQLPFETETRKNLSHVNISTLLSSVLP